MTNRPLSKLTSPLALVSLMSLAACGSYPSPVQHMATAQASVRAAEEVGAQQDPQAALHLKLAQEQLGRAKQLMADNDNKRADFILSRAESDAELAVAQSRQAQTRAQAQQAMDEVRALKQKAGLQ